MKPIGRSPRSQGQHFLKGAPLAFREKLEALYRENPKLSLVNAAQQTGAPRSVAATVLRRMRERGEIPWAHNQPQGGS